MTATFIFTKPGLLERYNLTLLETNWHVRTIAARSMLLEQGEWEFEQEIINHPYGVEIAKLGRGLPDDEFRQWLNDHFKESDFIMMPKNAMGKYADQWCWIFFRKKNQAALCKLTWF